MLKVFIGYLLTCGPLVLTLGGWIKLYFARHGQWPRRIALVALGIVTANAALAAGEFVYYELRPSRFVPPWEDPQILALGSLFLLAPIGMVVGFVAAGRGTPKWLIWIVEIASVPLFLVGVMAGMAV